MLADYFTAGSSCCCGFAHLLMSLLNLVNDDPAGVVHVDVIVTALETIGGTNEESNGVVEIVDLTNVSDSAEEESVPNLVSEEESDNSDNSDEVESQFGDEDWIDFAANAEDIVAIEFMLASGRGVYGHTNCVLERRPSRLLNAGFGIFLAEGAIIHNGMCMTEYDGQRITGDELAVLSNEDKLYAYAVDDVIISGLQEPVVGRGLGSFFNSAVAKRCHSFVRPVLYNNRIFFMCDVSTVYPLIGLDELYLTAGAAWWRLFRLVQQQQLLNNVQEDNGDVLELD